MEPRRCSVDPIHLEKALLDDAEAARDEAIAVDAFARRHFAEMSA